MTNKRLLLPSRFETRRDNLEDRQQEMKEKNLSLKKSQKKFLKEHNILFPIKKTLNKNRGRF